MNRHSTARRLLVGGLAALLASAPSAPAQVPVQRVPATEYEGAQALGLAARRLGHTRSVLMIGAHPDDESSQILSTLALGEGARVGYLSLTRGEGGQNGIGPELQEGLGLIRSEELLAARRLDGAHQFFTRAYDYGFSKSADEAFRHWPREALLADAVAVIREFRPDVVVSIFSGTERDGHGQHQAAGIIAREAFAAAADPARFPEQIARGLRPHAADKLYQALWRGDGSDYRLPTGTLDPLLGSSYYQVAMASRSRHRSQDMGRILTPGPQASDFVLVESRGASDPALFAGVDTTLSAAASAHPAADALMRYESAVAAAVGGLDLLEPGESVQSLSIALAALDHAQSLVDADEPLARRIADERAELVDVLWRAAGLRVDAVAEEETLAPGQTFELELSLWNGGREEVRLRSLEPSLPAGWTAEADAPVPPVVQAGELVIRRFTVRVPQNAEPTEPYFLRQPRSGDIYIWPDSVMVGRPFGPPSAQAAAEVDVAGATLVATRPAVYRGLDKMSGEIRRPLRVVPTVSLSVEPRLAVLPIERAGPVRLAVRLVAGAPGGVQGVLRPEIPGGWAASPREVPVSFARAGEERIVEIEIRPPADLEPGRHSVAMSFITPSGETFDRGFALVDYPHTAPRALYRPAATSVAALDVAVPSGLRVGYVAGPGDEVPAALRQLGVEVEQLGPEALASADLGAYDVIVTGIRAYEVRPDLATHNQRLLDYAAAGGTVIVQYNKYEYESPGIAPFAVAMSRPHGRVTDETAEVRILQPEHPVFNVPNRIGPADFDGWVQERGLYFLSEWDDALVPLLEMSDPGEDPLRGSLLVAPYGEGTYVYTGIAFFRQLPAGVPGAYRLFANLLALGDRR